MGEIFMDTQQCIKLRSSTRKYIDKPIPKETIYDILNATRYAPSPKNRQPWRFVVLQKIGLQQNAVKYYLNVLVISIILCIKKSHQKILPLTLLKVLPF